MLWLASRFCASFVFSLSDGLTDSCTTFSANQRLDVTLLYTVFRALGTGHQCLRRNLIGSMARANSFGLLKSALSPSLVKMTYYHLFVSFIYLIIRLFKMMISSLVVGPHLMTNPASLSGKEPRLSKESHQESLDEYR